MTQSDSDIATDSVSGKNPINGLDYTDIALDSDRVRGGCAEAGHARPARRTGWRRNRTGRGMSGENVFSRIFPADLQTQQHCITHYECNFPVSVYFSRGCRVRPRQQAVVRVGGGDGNGKEEHERTGHLCDPWRD